MPERCRRCRIDDGYAFAGLGCGIGMEELRVLREMMAAQERALVGMRNCLRPGIFGGMCKGTVESVEGRIEEVRGLWEREIDAQFEALEEKEGRVEW